MYRKEVSQSSPLRILERSIHGGLGPAHLGVIMSRAGVGKTAVLVQLGLDESMRRRNVLHIALGQSLEHVNAWYSSLFDDLAAATNLKDLDEARQVIAEHRLILARPETALSPEALEQIVGLYAQRIGFRPKALFIDGYDWHADPLAERVTDINGFKKLAGMLDSELWMTAQTHRSATNEHPIKLFAPTDELFEIIDLALFLEPVADHVSLRLLKDHDNTQPTDTNLELDCRTLRILQEGKRSESRTEPHLYTLVTCGTSGAEEAFGAAAESWNVGEVTYSSSTRDTARSRGLFLLDETELRQGEVSARYVERHLNRQLPHEEVIQAVLPLIWHQVTTSNELFCVGWILPDGTVKGGTGWAVELARHFNKKVYVFEQERKGWFTLTDGRWAACEAPLIRAARFAGTGTRRLSREGRRAIDELFARSFAR